MSICKRLVLVTVCVWYVRPGCVAAQGVPVGPPAAKPKVETSFALGIGAQLTLTRVVDPSIGFGYQKFDPSVALLGTVRQSVGPFAGYALHLGYTRTTEDNAGLGSLSYQTPYFAIPVNAYETSLAYLVQRHISPRVKGFAELGGGVLTFLPEHRGADAKNFVPGGHPYLVPSVLLRQLGVAGAGWTSACAAGWGCGWNTGDCCTSIRTLGARWGAR